MRLNLNPFLLPRKIAYKKETFFRNFLCYLHGIWQLLCVIVVIDIILFCHRCVCGAEWRGCRHYSGLCSVQHPLHHRHLCSVCWQGHPAHVVAPLSGLLLLPPVCHRSHPGHIRRTGNATPLWSQLNHVQFLVFSTDFKINKDSRLLWKYHRMFRP